MAEIIQVERVPSGIEGLDGLIEGGFEKGSTILVSGAAGTGKTTFALQFLYNGAVKYKEPGILLSFEESRESLYRHYLEFGWDFEKLEKENLFRVVEYKPHQVNKLLDEGGGTIKDTVNEINAKRIVVDSITSYNLLFKDGYQKRVKTLELFDLLKKWKCTSLIISEVQNLSDDGENSMSFLTDAVISLCYEKKEDRSARVHSLEILKMRATRHTNKVCALTFEDRGVVVYPEIEVF